MNRIMRCWDKISEFEIPVLFTYEFGGAKGEKKYIDVNEDDYIYDLFMTCC